MRAFLKRSVSIFLVPLVHWYLRKERIFKYEEISITVRPGVFHPGFFSSTLFIVEFLKNKPLAQGRILELGCGSGLISIVAARANGEVTASDLSSTAIENARSNFIQNKVDVKLAHSDLFDDIEKRQFDWIVINPPYYAHTIQNEADLAWHCGEDFQYFKKLFSALPDFMHPNTWIVMVLTQGCKLDKIFAIAEKFGFYFELLHEKRVLFDGKDFLYRIRRRDFGEA
jgi:release factor glutamine methyltransferase